MGLGDESDQEMFCTSGRGGRVSFEEKRMGFETKTGIYSRVMQTRKVSDRKFGVMAASSYKKIDCYSLYLD